MNNNTWEEERHQLKAVELESVVEPIRNRVWELDLPLDEKKKLVNDMYIIASKQISEAEGRGYQKGCKATFNRATTRRLGNHSSAKASSDMPECEVCPSGTHKDFPEWLSERPEGVNDAATNN